MSLGLIQSVVTDFILGTRTFRKEGLPYIPPVTTEVSKDIVSITTAPKSLTTKGKRPEKETKQNYKVNYLHGSSFGTYLTDSHSNLSTRTSHLLGLWEFSTLLVRENDERKTEPYRSKSMCHHIYGSWTPYELTTRFFFLDSTLYTDEP